MAKVKVLTSLSKIREGFNNYITRNGVVKVLKTDHLVIVKSLYYEPDFHEGGIPLPEKDLVILNDNLPKVTYEQLKALVERSERTNKEAGLFLDKDGNIVEAIREDSASVTYNPSKCIVDVHTHPFEGGGGYFSAIDDDVDRKCPGHVALLLSKSPRRWPMSYYSSYEYQQTDHPALYFEEWDYGLYGRVSLGKFGFVELTKIQLGHIIDWPSKDKHQQVLASSIPFQRSRYISTVADVDYWDAINKWYNEHIPIEDRDEEFPIQINRNGR